MKKMHWSAVIATSLISMTMAAGCSGDDAPPVGTAGTSATGATGGTGASGASTGGGGAGAGTSGSPTGGTGGGAAGGSTGGSGSGVMMGMQLQSPAYHVVLSATDAPAGMAAPESYSKNGCLGCHGPNAQGDAMYAPEIRFTPPDYFKAVVRGGRKKPDNTPSLMFAFGANFVSDADVDAMIAWANGLPKPTGGEGLYKAMCGNCHGPMTPTGGGSPIKIQGATAANVDKYVRMGGSGTDYNDRKTYMPKFDTTLLTDAELAMIKTFIGAQ